MAVKVIPSISMHQKVNIKAKMSGKCNCHPIKLPPNVDVKKAKTPGNNEVSPLGFCKTKRKSDKELNETLQ